MKPTHHAKPPLLDWLHGYQKSTFISDLIAGIIVCFMLIPQALAFAQLAGLPAEMGLYSSLLPLLAYALVGSSRTLSVGPVAVVSLMTATAIGNIGTISTQEAITAAITLASLSGLILLIMGALRFGFLANFLSHPVMSGFISAACIVIALEQLQHILGINAVGDTLPVLVLSLFHSLGDIHWPTVYVGFGATLLLFAARFYLQPLLLKLKMPALPATLLAKSAPVFVIVIAILLGYTLQFESHGIALVGAVPSGLPSLILPSFDGQLWQQLFLSALLISIIGFVESVSMAKTLGAKRRQRIVPNRELYALGGANIASAVSGGFPVTGGLSRSVVNFDAGAQTAAAGIIAAAGIAIAALFLTPALFYLPKAVLAATIIVAVSSLIDMEIIRRAWCYSISDFIAVMTTLVVTLLLGIELGVLGGIVVSITLHLYKTTRPHVAIIGEVAGTEHFRNVDRHNVITQSNLVSLRIDESLYFANASYLEDYVYALIANNDRLEHIIIQCTAVNEIDMSALEALESIDHRLSELGITLNLSEVKGPVMDMLQKTDFLQRLSGRVFLSQHLAVEALKTEEIEPYII